MEPALTTRLNGGDRLLTDLNLWAADKTRCLLEPMLGGITTFRGNSTLSNSGARQKNAEATTAISAPFSPALCCASPGVAAQVVASFGTPAAAAAAHTASLLSPLATLTLTPRRVRSATAAEVDGRIASAANTRPIARPFTVTTIAVCPADRRCVTWLR